MQKTLKDMGKHLKNLISSEIPEIYTVNPVFSNVSREENLREGVLAFRNFLYRICDGLISEGNGYDSRKKMAHVFDDRITLSVYYPFLHNVKYLLLNIGLHSELTDNEQCLTVGNNIFNSKIPLSKSLECLGFLTDCGMQFEGIDLGVKKMALSKIESIKICYPENSVMLIGLKAMAIAEAEFGVNGYKASGISYCRFSDILLRCDYRVLMNSDTEVLSIVKDTINPLSCHVQEFVLQLHQWSLDKGFKCDVEIKDLWVKIKYSYKRNEIWGINASLNNGYQINIKAKNMTHYGGAIEKFPSLLQKMIEKGYGCGKKRGISPSCDGGCRGFRISLDDSVLELRNAIEIWLDKELSLH